MLIYALQIYTTEGSTLTLGVTKRVLKLLVAVVIDLFQVVRTKNIEYYTP